MNINSGNGGSSLIDSNDGEQNKGKINNILNIRKIEKLRSHLDMDNIDMDIILENIKKINFKILEWLSIVSFSVNDVTFIKKFFVFC